jgi:hypothetical protein
LGIVGRVWLGELGSFLKLDMVIPWFLSGKLVEGVLGEDISEVLEFFQD